MKLTEKGKKLTAQFKTFYDLNDDEQKLLILLDAGEKSPNKSYYGDSIKSLKKKGLIV
jgi:hypothetical protein